METELDIQKRLKSELAAQIRDRYAEWGVEGVRKYRQENLELCQANRKKYYVDNLEAIKQYRVDNKGKLASYSKEYNIINKVEIAAKHKVWYAANKDKINANKKEYRVNNPEAVADYKKKYSSADVLCDCGATVKRGCYSQHKKTQRHIAFIRVPKT